MMREEKTCEDVRDLFSSLGVSQNSRRRKRLKVKRRYRRKGGEGETCGSVLEALFFALGNVCGLEVGKSKGHVGVVGGGQTGQSV